MSAVPVSFEPEPASVGAARRYAVGLLQDSPVRHLQDDIRTVVSELATNAVLHARTPFTLTVRVDSAGVRIAVTDASPSRPRLPRRGDLSGTTGRGLRIIAQLSADWGVDVHDDGKTTWCLVRLTGPDGPTRRQDTEVTGSPPLDERKADPRPSLSHRPADESTPAAPVTGGPRHGSRTMAA